jgi:hypothetical protein
MTTHCRVSSVEGRGQRNVVEFALSLTPRFSGVKRTEFRSTVLTVSPRDTFSQLATFNLQHATASVLTGHLTRSNGLPNGSNFCKSLKTRKVYGLTGKTPPGSPYGKPHPSPTSPTRPSGLTSSNPVQPNPTKSNQIQPGPPLPPAPLPLGL